MNEFTVNRPIAETWAVLTDVERIAPCMPGAQLEEIEGDVYRGVVKVKLGAISTAFKGQAKFVERDDEHHRAVLHGEGRDTTGKGNADAMITATLEQTGASTTKCVVETDLRITGKVAQFGRGIMGDVSKKLMAQFASNLNTMLDQSGPDESGPDESGSTPAPTSAGTSSATPAVEGDDVPADSGPDVSVAAAAAATAVAADATRSGTKQAGTTQAGTTPPDTTAAPKPAEVRKIDGPAAEPIELSGVAGSAVLKRLLPAVGGLVALLLVLRRLRRR